MEAPEKIYLTRILCSNEVYDNWKSQKTISDDIEYTRTDTFIDKAIEYIAHCSQKQLNALRAKIK